MGVPVSKIQWGTLAQRPAPHRRFMGAWYVQSDAIAGLYNCDGTIWNLVIESVVSTAAGVRATVAPDISAAIPAGAILAWSGSAASIPSGWTLCNGSNGTPDLRGRFMIGAGGAYSVGANGGAASQSYTPAGTNSAPVFTGTPQTFSTGLLGLLAGLAMENPNPYTPAGTVSAPTFTGSADSITTLPPYYALCWIMKL